jgi:hypothetical protein
MATPSTPNPPTKAATSVNPKIVMMAIDNSGSMKDKARCERVTEAVQDLMMTIQSINQGASRAKVIMSLCSFGDDVKELAMAALPKDIDLDALTFNADQEGTNLHLALKWAVSALEESLDQCRRQIAHYQEQKSPNPLLMVLTDAEDIDLDSCRPYMEALAKVPIQSGALEIVAVGVEVLPKDLEVLKKIATREDYAIQIGSEDIEGFLGDFRDTFIYPQKTLEELASKRR